MARCILCETNAITSRQDYASRTIYNCPYCGVFVISDLVEEEVAEARHRVAAFMVNRNLCGSNDILMVSPENLKRDKGYVYMTVEQIVSNFPDSMLRRMGLTLQNLIMKSEYAGAEVRVENLSQGPLFYLEKVNFESMSFAIASLEKRGLITVNYYGSSFFPCNIIVSADGWEFYAQTELSEQERDSALVTITGGAGWADEYMRIVTRACKTNGFRTMDNPIFSGEMKLGYRLMAEMRDSRFLICDLSDGAPEAYFAAGMAKALNKVVIFTCRSQDKKGIRLDTNHMSVLLWENTEQLGELVSNAIRALVF